MNPYAQAAPSYLAGGFSPVPVPYGRKGAPVPGFTGAEGAWVDDDHVQRWSRQGARNICLRLPDGVLGLDVDAYEAKPGGETLQLLESELGPLPTTWVSTSRKDDPISGIRLYRVPEGREWKDAGPGMETIRWGHRYAVVAPSKHPEGRIYGWRNPHGDWSKTGPAVIELPELPEAWIQRLMKPELVVGGGAEEDSSVGVLGEMAIERHPYASRAIEAELVRLDEEDMLGWSGAGWDNTCFEVACNLVEFGNSDWSGWSVDELHELFMERAPRDDDFDPAAKWESGRKAVGDGDRREPLGTGDEDDGFDPVGDGSELDVLADHYDPWDVSGDANLGQRLAHDYLRGHYLAWGRGRWAKWDGRKWDLEVPEDEVLGYARNALLDILVYELGKADKRRDALIRSAGVDKATVDLAMETHEQRTKALKRLRSLGVIQSALKLARGLVVVRLEDFDGEPTRWLLNCGNGVVDLRTGELRDWDRELLFTRVSPVNYVPGAETTDWTVALQAIPEDVREWLQRRIGQAATGFVPPDDVVPFWYGDGSNGKTSILTGVREALGPFFVAVPDKVLTGGAGDHPTEFMTLKGVRMAVIEELPGGDWLEDTRLKKVVGSESGMTARWIGQNNVTWKPTHSLMVTTNHEIRVSDMTLGTWRRLARVPFPYKFDAEAVERGEENARGVITGLRERIAAGLSAEATLAWIVEGAVRCYGADGVPLVREGQPERVRVATLEWKLDGDPLPRFLREVLVADGTSAVETSLLYAMYREWSSDGGLRPVSDQTFWSRYTQVKRDVGLRDAEKKVARVTGWEVAGRGTNVTRRMLCGARLTDAGRALLERTP